MNTQPSVTEHRNNNAGFKDISNTFLEKGWTAKINEPTHLEFQSPTSEYDTFEFEVDKKDIYVSVPLKSSRYKYTTKFSDYFAAFEFAEMHLLNF